MHTPFIIQDSNEPKEMKRLLQSSINTVTASLNTYGYADYRWQDIEGNYRQWERKQLGEYLSNMEKTEAQLNEELRTCRELTLCIEGVGMPTPDGVQTFKLSKNGDSWKKSYAFTKRPSLYYEFEARKWSLRKAGVEVVETYHLEGTAQALVAAVRKSFQPESTTFRRYVREHIAPFDPNPHVDNLIRIKNNGVGEVLAIKLIDRFETLWGVMSASRDDLENCVGKGATKNLLRAIGRED
jgi:hypothetical protein